MPFMIRTNVIGNCPEKKDTFGTGIEEYFDDRIDATKAYEQLLVDIRDGYADSADHKSITLVYLYEYQRLNEGGHTGIVITASIRSVSISCYGCEELFLGWHKRM